MDRFQFFMLGFPIFLLCSDLVNLYSRRPTPPPPPHSSSNLADVHRHHHHHHLHHPSPVNAQVPDFSSTQIFDPHLKKLHFFFSKFCVSRLFRGIANSLKQMLEESFPGIKVVLSNHPPSLPKRVLSKVFPIVQARFIGIIVEGEHILLRHVNIFYKFDEFCLRVSHALRDVFSKLEQKRFPDALELKDLIGNILPSSAFGKNLNWS
ncbi:Selenoprotein T protein [Dioscorea alata]|uniref:Selenoprotein T protein n=1 Tax=Dioscorea alata TaxID=55571 RepID=A0ACB7U8X4_DIOAL|nr:Selenoprotein T protein [Dioscorea alata]